MKWLKSRRRVRSFARWGGFRSKQESCLNSDTSLIHTHTHTSKHTYTHSHTHQWADGKFRRCSVHPHQAGLYLRTQERHSQRPASAPNNNILSWSEVFLRSLSSSLTLQQLQAGAASCAHVADLIFCVPLGAAGGGVAPTWTQTRTFIQDLKKASETAGLHSSANLSQNKSNLCVFILF